MNITTMGWKPDFCNCQVNLAIDLDLPPIEQWEKATAIESRVRASGEIAPTVICEAHSYIKSLQELFKTLDAESRLKEDARKVASNLFPSLKEEVPNALVKGGTIPDGKFDWEFDQDRNFIVRDINGTTDKELQEFKEACDAELGEGRVWIGVERG